MKRLIAGLLALIMLLGSASTAFAYPGEELRVEKNKIQEMENRKGLPSMEPFSIKPGRPGMMPRSIAPSTEKIHEFRFYCCEEEALAAQNGTGPDEPFDTKKVRTDGILEQQELVEQKDELFEGWFYQENGVEKEVPFGTQKWISENKTFYAYPKRSKVITVFFSHANTVVKSVLPDDEGYVSLEDQPGVGEENKVLTGWAMEEDFDTAEAAEDAGKLFYFKEHAIPTKVEGTLVLHAIFEDAIRISFDTHGSTVLPGKYIDKAEDVEVPPALEKEGYVFQYWYVMEKDENSPTGEREVKLNTIKVDGKEYFDYDFTKNTTIHAKWKGEEVDFSIIFMRENRPDQIAASGEEYEFLGYFKNPSNPDLQITKGIAGSNIVFDDDSSAEPDEITSLDKDQFQSYLEQTNNNRNLLKYANLLNVDKDLLKGFHVNKEKTNEEECIIEGDGLTTKIVYLDRDTVHLRVHRESGSLNPTTAIESETTNATALGDFKYGESLKGNDNRGWTYILNKYNKNANPVQLLANYRRNLWFTTAPYAVEESKVGNYTGEFMFREGDHWVFAFRVTGNFGDIEIVSVPLRLPLDKQDISFEEALDWIRETDINILEDHLLPSKEEKLITTMKGFFKTVGFRAEDFPVLDGYQPINPEKTQDMTNSVVKGKLLDLADESGNQSNYAAIPIIYKKKNFNLIFQSNATNHPSQTVLDIPYHSVLVSPPGPAGGDPNDPDLESTIVKYLAKFEKAEIDKDTKEVTNLDTVTKNQDGELFMGWYLDPSFTLPFDEHMPMPAHNLQVFAKWEPLYHYIKVHHFPVGTTGVDNPKNITEIKVPHGQAISETENEILTNPPIPAGRSSTDFQGWETYGDVTTNTPSPSGTGGPFKYSFDSPVNTGFHLYPRWDVEKVRVVYAFNYQDNNNQPLSEGIIEDEIMENLDIQNSLVDLNNYYMSEYMYILDSNVRLRAPLGWDADGRIIEPTPPAGSAAEGKIFLGWQVMYRDKDAPHTWHKTGDLVYYNSEVRFTENAISHDSTAQKGDAIGAMVLVAQWGEKKISTNITLHRNHSATDDVTKVYKIENLNEDWALPNEDHPDLTGFKRDKFQFIGWNTEKDGSGKMYKAGDNILIDEHHDEHLNHLYAQWQKYYNIEAEKIWEPNNDNYNFKMGLIRRTAPSETHNPDFSELGGFMSVPGSLKSYKTDLSSDGKMKWEVPGLDEDGNRYSYIIVEVTPDMEDAFNNFTAWEDLNVNVIQEYKTKKQIISLENTETNEIDAFSSATVRTDKRIDNEIVGYHFDVTNTKIEVPMPIITQPYADQEEIKITPAKDPGNQVEKIKVTLPDDTVLTLTKDAEGHFTESDNADYEVTADPTGKLTIQLPAGQKLVKDQVIKAVAINKNDVESDTDEKTVLDAQDSFKIKKPVQQKRDQQYKVVIKASIPSATTVEDGTTFTLTDEFGNAITDENDNPITGTLDESGKNVIFKVKDGILKDGQKVKVETQEPTKQPTLSDLSEELDIDAPVITANDIIGKVGVPIEPMPVVTVEDKDLTDLFFSMDNLPADFEPEKDTANSTDTVFTFNIVGAGKYVITKEDNHSITYLAMDRFGNKAVVTVQAIISDKDLVGAPVIDTISTGDTTVAITPPSDGDRLVVGFPDGSNVTLEKQDGKWVDPVTGKEYTPDDDGKINVDVAEPLKEGDMITAQGKDSSGKLADSPVVTESVKKSDKKTPTPQFDKVTVGDTVFKIKPVDDTANGIVTDKIVVTIRDEEGNEKKKIILTKDLETGKWSDGTKEYEIVDGYLTVNIPTDVTLNSKYSFGATGEDKTHGHEISDPTSINVNAKQSDKPTAEQGPTTDEGNPTITGKGEPGADINVYDPTTGDLIAGPVKVKEDGTYEIELPKDSVPDDGKVDVKQKEDGKPESEPAEVTIVTKAPDAPVIDQPKVGDEEVKITPPAGAEKMTITLPNGDKVELTKTPDGKWSDGTNEYTPDTDGKITIPTPPLKNNDVIKGTAADEFDNTSPETSVTVGDEDSFAVEKPEQKPKDNDGNIVIESKVPEEANPADGTEYILTDDEGNPILDPDTNEPIKATPDKDGKLEFVVPDGVLKDKDQVKVQVKEPGKNATLSEESAPLDLLGPVITANDIIGTVGIEISEAKITTNEEAEITVSPNLPNSLVLGDANADKTEWIISGKGEFETTTTHKVVAVDKFGNETEAEFKVTITKKEKTEKPQIDPITEGDESIKVTPPENADTITVKWPDGKTSEITKGDDGKWKDQDNNEIPVEDGKLVVPVPEGTELNNLDIVKANAQDKANNKSPSDDAERAVGGKSTKPTAKQGETKENGNPTITGTGIPGSDINVYDKDGNKIAGPVKVKEDGTYEVELPKDSVPDDGKVDVKQTEKDKPESEPVEVTITEDIIPVTDPNNPPTKPDGYITVTFDETEKGTLPDGTTKVYYVAANRVVSLTIPDPTGKKDGVIEYRFNEWDHALKAQFTKDTRITAIYDMKWIDIKPLPGIETSEITTNIGEEPTEQDYRDAIKADGNPLPDGATLDIVQPDVSTPGNKEAKVTITFEDGSKSVVAVPVKVLKDIYPSWDGKRPMDAPDSYVKVSLDPTEKGYYDNGPKYFFVRPDKEVSIPANDAKGIVVNNKAYTFKAWNRSLTDTFTEDTIIQALYDEKNNCPTCPTHPQPKPEPTPDQPEDPSPDQGFDTDRIHGIDRIVTAIELSKQKYDAADTVIIARHDVFADALVAAPLAYALDAPILLSKPHEFLQIVGDEIERLGAKNVIIVGGYSSIDDHVEDALEVYDENDEVERLSGPNRYDTSAKVAYRLQEIYGDREDVIIATGESYPDALAVGPYAARDGKPILLVHPHKIPQVIEQAMTDIGTQSIEIVGGYSSVGKELEKDLPKLVARYQGKDRYETAVAIAKETKKDAKVIYLASGEIFADALVAGPVAAKDDAPILLTRRNEVPKVVRDYLEGKEIDKLTIIGGRNTITDASIKSLYQ